VRIGIPANGEIGRMKTTKLEKTNEDGIPLLEIVHLIIETSAFT
jgi:hypothetical protein